MPILCLNLNARLEASCAEAFLPLSPRVQFRDPGYIFADLKPTLGLLGGEDRAIEKALDIAHKLCPKSTIITAAIGEHPYTAQVFTEHLAIVRENSADHQRLAPLPTSALCLLEGLSPWSKPRQVQSIVQFFQNLGLKKLEQVMHFPLASFRERWAETGTSLWKRLHGQELQALSPLIPTDPFLAYRFLEHSISIVEPLMLVLEEPLRRLFLRLEGQQKFARRIEINLHCEYSQKVHPFCIEPVAPNRDLQLFLDLIENKLGTLDLYNPIKEFEITLFEQSEKVQQMDFFEPHDQQQDRWRRLLSFAQSSGLEMGFLQPEPSHFPERSFSLLSDWPKDFAPQDYIKQIDASVQVRFVYAKGLSRSPRPSLLLDKPVVLPMTAVKKMKFLSSIPAERIESSWWEHFRKHPHEDHRRRDYYFAISPEGQLLWLFRDGEDRKYYLHGYFD